MASGGVRVAVDAMGGDHAPGATVAGVVLAAREMGLPVALVGHADVLQAKLTAHDTADLPITVHHAPDVIRMDEPPVSSLRRKPRSSLRVAFELVRHGAADAVVSAGNSGAVMAAALFTFGRLRGVSRPAIAVSIPAAHGRVILVDAGASVDSRARDLVEFALMGDVYAKALCGFATPRVGLLSNGHEDGKGTETTRAASAVLRGLPLNYTGYVEGHDLARGSVDVVVCDGFVGNAVLKAIEGASAMVGRAFRDSLLLSWRGRLAYALARPAFSGARERLDYAAYGGAPLLGVDGVAVVAHGGSSARALRNAIRVAHDAVRLGINRHIADALAAVDPEVMPDRGGRRRLWAQLRGRLSSMRDGHEDGPADMLEETPATDASGDH